MPTAPAPRTADGDGFRFRAGRLSLDLCSTVLWRALGPIEQLDSPAAVARWLAEAGVRTPATELSGTDAARFRDLREACFTLFGAHLRDESLPGVALDTLNHRARGPEPAPRLHADGTVSWTARNAFGAASADVARDAIDLLTGPWSARVRECAAPDCSFLFVDTSRPGTRRWCAANRCGNREHVRTFRRRGSAAAEDPINHRP